MMSVSSDMKIKMILLSTNEHAMMEWCKILREVSRNEEFGRDTKYCWRSCLKRVMHCKLGDLWRRGSGLGGRYDILEL